MIDQVAHWRRPTKTRARSFAAGTYRKRGVSSGQAIVEFALVITPVLMMIFGIVEFSLITSSIGTFNFAAKDAARLGALLGRTDSTVDQQMVTLVRNHVVSFVTAKTVSIEIYRSDATGAYSSAAEDKYDINGNVIGTQSWPPDARSDDLIDADFLGVRITFRYTYLTAFVSSGAPTLTLTASSVQRIEPQDFQSYRAQPPITVTAAVSASCLWSTLPCQWPWGQPEIIILDTLSQADMFLKEARA